MNNERWLLILVAVFSVAIPAVVAMLLFSEMKGVRNIWDVSFLPALNASINGTVTFLLISARFSVKLGKIQLHRSLMISAFFLSVIFLLSYVTYHAVHGHDKFLGEGTIRYIYLFILLTHILLSIVVVPLVLLSLIRGLKRQDSRHKKIVKWAWPIWLYVSSTGVLVFLFAHVFNNPVG